MNFRNIFMLKYLLFIQLKKKKQFYTLIVLQLNQNIISHNIKAKE